jgi:hypothetical protein
LICYAGQALTGQVYKFAHGGQTPITTLAEKYAAIGCAVDPDTGDLAASNAYSSVSGHGTVAVFEKASGKPKTPNYIYRVTVANGVAQIVGTTTLDGLFHRPPGGDFWIDGTHVTEARHSAPRDRPLRLLIWRYFLYRFPG